MIAPFVIPLGITVLVIVATTSENRDQTANVSASANTNRDSCIRVAYNYPAKKWMMLYVLVGLFVSWFGSDSQANLKFAAVMWGIALLAWLFGIRNTPVSAIVNPRTGLITVHYGRFSGRGVQTTPIAKWKKVRSYISSPGRYAKNVVELESAEGSVETLSLSIFEPSTVAGSWGIFSRYAESPRATHLRLKLTRTGLFEDGGFVDQ